jgi:alcohol dehydrogenase class IV
VAEGFTFRDGERLVRFGEGALAEAPSLIEEQGLGRYALLTTPRAAEVAPELARGAEAVLHVPAGLVDEISAELLPQAAARSLVALGGGRVIDTAKAIAGAGAGRCAAIPTTLSGAPMTPFHRLPVGIDARFTRPALVIAEPRLMASQAGPHRSASAMNALAHAMESLYTPFANPVAEMRRCGPPGSLPRRYRATTRTARRSPWRRCSPVTRWGRPAWPCTTRSARHSFASAGRPTRRQTP